MIWPKQQTKTADRYTESDQFCPTTTHLSTQFDAVHPRAHLTTTDKVQWPK